MNLITKIIINVLICLIGKVTIAQAPREITPSELDSIIKAVNVESDKYKEEYLKQASRHCAFNNELTIEFEIDTFKIENIQRKRIEIDYSTAGMLKATYSAIDEYDILLNKYYKLLLNVLNDQDAEILRETQRNWIIFRDSEVKFIGVMSKEEYSDGGSIQSLIRAGRIFDITQKRVIDLFEYSRLVMKKRP